MARKKRKVSGPRAEPPVAADRSRAKPSRSRSAPNSSQSAQRERLPAFSAAMPRLTAEIEDLPVERVGVQHARVHLGGQLLPHPRRQQQMGRPDLAQIVHHRALGLRETHPDAREQRHRRHIDLFDDPGQRQDRDVLVGRLARIGAQIGRTVLQERPVLQHRELGVRGGAGRGAQHRDVLAAPRRDRRFEPLRRDVRATRDQLRAAAAAGRPRICACRADRCRRSSAGAAARPRSPGPCRPAPRPRRTPAWPRRTRADRRPPCQAHPRRCRATSRRPRGRPARPTASAAGCGR